MNWNNIIGQDRVKMQLWRAILEEKIASSYCFWGPDGVGKDALALEFARTANCLSPKISNGKIEACGTCISCKSAAKFQNPNIRLIYSLPAFSKSSSADSSALSGATPEQIRQIEEELRLKSENPYHKISIPGASQIRISSVRDLKRELSLSGGSGRKFVIIMRADEMTQEASNALLKTLEEPQPNTTIILTTSRRELLLQTILSRTQQIHCEAISDSAMISALTARLGISTEEAGLAAAFAQGSFRAASDFLNSQSNVCRTAAIDLFRNALSGKFDRAEMLKILDPYTKSKDKSGCEEILVQLEIWIRDGMKIAASGNYFTGIFNLDKTDTAAKFARNFQSADFASAIDIIDQGITDLHSNVAKDLAMINVFIRLRRQFRSIFL